MQQSLVRLRWRGSFLPDSICPDLFVGPGHFFAVAFHPKSIFLTDIATFLTPIRNLLQICSKFRIRSLFGPFSQIKLASVFAL